MALEASFKDKRVLVTGAARGLGREVVAKLHSYGAKIIALSQTPEMLQKLESDFPGIKTICVDIGDWDKTRSVLMELDPVDCVVNNAAALECNGIMHTTPDQFDRIYAVNTKGVMNVIQVMAGKLMEAKKPGSIVNVSSVVALRAFPLCGAYSTSKAAMEHMSRSLAVELGPHQIRVNVVQPALMKTTMGDQFGEALCKLMGHETYTQEVIFGVLESRTPTQKVWMPVDEVANTILFVLSDLCPQMTGQFVAVDGGYLAT